jgi:hypothetical protein
MTENRANTVAELFDKAGRLRHVKDLPLGVAAQLAQFELVRITTRQKGKLTVTEETIRVQLRDAA